VDRAVLFGFASTRKKLAYPSEKERGEPERENRNTQTLVAFNAIRINSEYQRKGGDAGDCAGLENASRGLREAEGGRKYGSAGNEEASTLERKGERKSSKETSPGKITDLINHPGLLRGGAGLATGRDLAKKRSFKMFIKTGPRKKYKPDSCALKGNMGGPPEKRESTQ